MSLWDFTKDMGRNLFTNDSKAAEKISEHILANNPGVENLEVTFEDGVAYLSGKFDDRIAFEKTLLMAGNIKGVKRVDIQRIAFKKAKVAAPEPGPLDVADVLGTAVDERVVATPEEADVVAGEVVAELEGGAGATMHDAITEYVVDSDPIEVINAEDLVDPTVTYYEIQSGDSLSKIAKEFYGDPMKYKDLFAANREVIEDPDKIYPGQKIRIPPLY